MNITEEQKKEAELEITKRDERLIPITEKILEVISTIKLPSALSDQTAFDLAYEEQAKAILTILKESGCTAMDYDYVKSRLNGAFMYIFDKLIDTSLNITMDLLNKKVYGKPMNEMTFEEIDALLKK